MKKITGLLTLLLGAQLSQGQQSFTYRATDLEKVLPFAEVTVSRLPDDWNFELKPIRVQEAPEPATFTGNLKAELDRKRMAYLQQRGKYKNNQANAVAEPTLISSFAANFSNGTPNDNSMAISNAGKIVSVVNTNVRFHDQDGTFLANGKTLAAFTGSQLSNLDRTFDPRAIYDPLADRFIVMYLQGDSSDDSRIVLGFSQSNDPAGAWKWYALQGNKWNNGTWFDYPIIAISDKDLFITGNLLVDGKGWKDGFTQSIIWQVKKQDGYNGQALSNRVYDNIKYNNKSIWNICPVQGGSAPYGPETFFVSLRPGDAKNDSVFLQYVTNSLESGQAALGLKVMKSDKTYGVPPSAIQPSGQKLQTNDARALSAMIEEGVIYFAGNSIDTNLFAPGVYFGRITGAATSNPSVTAQIISYDSLDIGYPSLAYPGAGTTDKSVLMTFSHVSTTTFPGTSALFFDRFGQPSAPLRVKAGLGSINVLSDSNERWGDYTGIQRKYNEKGVVWMSGSFGETDASHKTVLARVKNNDPQLSARAALGSAFDIQVYPNPSAEKVQLHLQEAQGGTYDFALYDLNGRLLKQWPAVQVASGDYTLSFDCAQLLQGTYLLKISHEGFESTRKFILAR